VEKGDMAILKVRKYVALLREKRDMATLKVRKVIT